MSTIHMVPYALEGTLEDALEDVLMDKVLTITILCDGLVGKVDERTCWSGDRAERRAGRKGGAERN